MTRSISSGPAMSLRFPTYFRLEAGIERHVKLFKFQPWIGVRVWNALDSFLPGGCAVESRIAELRHLLQLRVSADPDRHAVRAVTRDHPGAGQARRTARLDRAPPLSHRHHLRRAQHAHLARLSLRRSPDDRRTRSGRTHSAAESAVADDGRDPPASRLVRPGAASTSSPGARSASASGCGGWCFDTLLKQDIQFFDSRDTGEITTRLWADVPPLEHALGDELADTLKNVGLRRLRNGAAVLHVAAAHAAS